MLLLLLPPPPLLLAFLALRQQPRRAPGEDVRLLEVLLEAARGGAAAGELWLVLVDEQVVLVGGVALVFCVWD